LFLPRSRIREVDVRDKMASMFRGIMVLEGVLDEDACARIRHAMDLGTPEAAEILDRSIELQQDVRRTSHIEVDRDTLSRLEQTLDAQHERVEGFFGLRLPSREGVSLLRYSAGGFFKPHRDRGDADSWPDAARRRVSLVLFLCSSREIEARGTFSGGALRVHADDAHASWQDIHPRAGTLVAFLSTTLHEVLPVHDGIRDAVVDWCYDAG
jgi:predicted 2-oxoglutarate/Fe(II)-dependent dioxygenase YbiX